MATVINQNQDQNANTPQQNGTAANGQPLQTVGTAQPQGSNVPGSAASTSSNGTTAPAASGQPQGSGRFTNLSKYLNANQAGGQRIAQDIGQNINNNLQQQNQQSQNYYNQLGNTINNANQTAQQGAGYVKQLNNIGTQIQGATLTPEQLADPKVAQAALQNRGNQDLSSIQNFTQSPDFSNFQNIQAGRGIDENLLAQQQAKALNTAQGTVSAAQQAQQNLGSEDGRFQLLQNQFGGGNHPGYSQGDQRLDQVLLGQSGGLGKVQQSVADQGRAAATQAKLAQGAGNDVSRLAAQEQGLVGDINTAGTNNETAYKNMLNSYIDPTNTDRAAQVTDLNRAIGTYQNPKAAYAPGFNTDQMTKLGLTDKNQGVYNVFNGVNGVKSANDIATIGPNARSAAENGYQDVANQTDVDRYGALAKMLGNTDQKDLTAPSTLGNAYTAKTDDNALTNRLAAAQTAYNTAAQGNLSGYYNGQGSGETDFSANANNLINQGHNAVNMGKGSSIENINDVASGKAPGYQDDAQYIQNNQYSGNTGPGSTSNAGYVNLDNSLRNFLTQQNYNQTIGGKRQTYLDSLNANGTVKADPGGTQSLIPITGQDPAKLAALQNLANGKVTGNV